MKYKIILSLVVLALISSAILSFIPLEKACGIEDNQCVAVQTSQYEQTLGISNAHLGLIAFFALFVIIMLHIKKPTKRKKQLILTGLIIGSIIAIYFLYLQFFVIKALCKYCMITDISILIALTTFFISKKD